MYIDNKSFGKVEKSCYDVITYNREPILSNKAVALYFDKANIPHYIYDTEHDQLAINEPFTAIYNSGQIWKFMDVGMLYNLMDKIDVKKHQGTRTITLPIPLMFLLFL